jgi:hypothetical protein
MGQVQQFKCMNDINGRNFPFQVAFAKIDENVIILLLELLKLPVCRQLIQEHMIYFIVGQ